MKEPHSKSKNQKPAQEKPHVNAAHDVVISVDGQQVAAQYRSGSVVFTTSGPVSFAELSALVSSVMAKARKFMEGGA